MSQSNITAFMIITFALIVVFIVLDLIIKLIAKNNKRPSEITTLVIILAIGYIRQLTIFIQSLYLFDLKLFLYAIIYLFWLFGIWKMKKWGAYGYIATSGITQLLLIIQNQLTIFSIFVIFEVVLLYTFISKMK